MKNYDEFLQSHFPERWRMSAFVWTFKNDRKVALNVVIMQLLSLIMQWLNFGFLISSNEVFTA